MKYVKAFFCLFIESWMPITLAFAQSPLLSTAQRQGDTIQVSINRSASPLGTSENYYGDNPSKTDAPNTVTRERMNKGMITNTLDALSGQAAGVQVQTGGNHEAMLSAVRVRGTTSLTGGNDPLVVIDGVQSDIITLSTIYPADIESFTILKDASETSQYGSRGAAGVIQVVTRKGKAEQFHIAYDGSVGFESTYKNLHMLNADEFRQVASNLGMSIIDKGANTDFTEAPLRTGFVQNHHLAFGGGSETANYRASVGMTNHRTTIENNNLRNYIAKLDLHQEAFDNRLTVDLGVLGSAQDNNVIPFRQKLFYSAATFNPTFPAGTNAAGGYDDVPEAWWISNPYALLTMKEDEENSHANVHAKAKVDLGYGLTLTVFGSYSFTNIGNAHYYPTYVWSHGEAYQSDRKIMELLGNIALNWRGRMAEHHQLGLLGLIEGGRDKDKGFYATSSNINTNAFGYDNLSAGAIRPWGGTNSFKYTSSMRSYLMKAQYTFDDRYTLNISTRLDGSSKVGENHRWEFFPSASGTWNVTNEKWMAPLKHYVSKLNLRVGYGKSGNLGGIEAFLSQQLIRPNGVVSVGGMPTTTMGIVRNANPDLGWEIKRTFNIGLDMAFWDNRIVLTADFYTSRTSDMLYNYTVPVPTFTYDHLLANLGKMRNHGLEIGFGITPLQQKDMELNINMNWTFERNKLVTLNGYYQGQYLTAPDVQGISGLYGAGYHGASGVCFQIVGETLGVFFLPHCKGFTTAADGSKRYDLTTEKYICGQATPKAMMGSNIAFRYKQLDITMQVNGAFGHKIYNGTALAYMNMASLPNYNVMQGAPEMNIQDQDISDYWLEPGDYVNFDYVTLGWNVLVRSRYISKLRVACSVNNLATITSYSGLTPMINSSVVDSTLGVDDKRAIPPYRTYSLALSIQF